MTMMALKLDSSYRPIEVIDAIEALVMCIIGKATPVETYDEKINSPSKSFSLPAVIVLKTIVKFRLNTISCNRLNVIWRDNNQCQYCTKTFPDSELTMDHVMPKSRGGLNTWENLATACKKCNQKKGSRTSKESGMYPLNKPTRPRASILKSVSKNQISDLWKDYLWEHS
jgi:5-methylcytosine-specific restriction endonuclease McrA